MKKVDLHFLGIAGSFMAGVARLALEAGFTVSGSDRAFYPPMGDAAKKLKVPLLQTYDADCKQCPADLYVVGNAVGRGNPLMESILRRGRPYISAPQWLFENVLRGRRVLAVAGTHGKTTTTSLLAYILQQAGKNPGFLLGGVENNFGVSARLSASSEFFVIESDEYDTAFFDKRPKFMHYRPAVAVLNNLEFDHADIYASLREIVLQFHYLLRTLPDNGRVIARAGEANIGKVIKLGCNTPIDWFGRGRRGKKQTWHWKFAGGEMFVYFHNKEICRLSPPLPLPGAANRDNITAAIAAAAAAGVDAKRAAEFLQGYRPPLRRMQRIGEFNGAVVYDDFAHHPTAIRKTISALAEMGEMRGKEKHGRTIAVFEPRSNSMKAGVFAKQLAPALAAADIVIACGKMPWLAGALKQCKQPVFVEANAKATAARLKKTASKNDNILLMSNGDFGGLAGLLVGKGKSV